MTRDVPSSDAVTRGQSLTRTQTDSESDSSDLIMMIMGGIIVGTQSHDCMINASASFLVKLLSVRLAWLSNDYLPRPFDNHCESLTVKSFIIWANQARACCSRFRARNRLAGLRLGAAHKSHWHAWAADVAGAGRVRWHLTLSMPFCRSDSEVPAPGVTRAANFVPGPEPVRVTVRWLSRKL